MLKNMICPDGVQCSKDSCAARCRMAERCAPKAYLQLVTKDRPWNGVPSVTQLINGTRMEYLKLTTDWAINPDKSAFMLLGTMGHAELEANNDEDDDKSEKRITLMGISGQPDSLELQDDGTHWLIDYKTSGLFKIKKLCAYEDVDDWELQVNMYRIMAEKEYGIVIAKQKIFAVARDGGTWMAKKDGMLANTYYKDIRKLDDEGVLFYFQKKRDALLTAMETGNMPAICNDHEAWGGRRCKDYCPVSEACKAVGDNGFL